jgi:hypothetical protein
LDAFSSAGRDLERLRTIDGGRIADFLAGQDEFRRAFPTFFRAVGHEVCTRLSPTFPGIAAHVGEDYRRAAIDRLNNPLPPLDWVAFSFTGHSMWDLHVGVVARLDVFPPVAQVGIHWTDTVASDIAPVVQSIDWLAAVGSAGELANSPAVNETQQRDVADRLDVHQLASEAIRYANRAIRYYTATHHRVSRLPRTT